MSIAVIINPVAGGANPALAPARAKIAAAVLDRRGETGDVFVTERAGHARELARACVGRGVRLVVAWGGDGTVNEVASELAFSGAALGIIPAGSGNGLATELGIDPNPERSLAGAMTATPSVIDLGEIGGRLFVNAAGIGIDAYVASQFNEPRNIKRGFRSYLRIGARALFTYKPSTYRILTSEATLTSRAVLIAVANGAQWGNGARIAPGARLDDGRLDLVVVEEKSRVMTMARTPRLFNGSIASAPGCALRRIQEVTIECADPMTFHVDGEPVRGGTTLTARVRPHALKLCVK